METIMETPLKPHYAFQPKTQPPTRKRRGLFSLQKRHAHCWVILCNFLYETLYISTTHL